MGYFCCISDFAYAKIILMNKGENSGMPNGPIFSSPNISGGEPSKQEAVPMPEEQVDITKVADPAVATTIASMPDAPEKPIVTSGGDPVDKKKPRFGLGTRRFKEKSQQPAAPIMQAAQTPAFANAPEFFNDAVGDIVLADAADAEKKSKTKKLLVIGVVAAVAVIALLVVALTVIPSMKKAAAADDLQKSFRSFANLFLYNKQNDGPIEGTYDVKASPYAVKSSADLEYADKLKKSYNDFYSRYDKSEIKGKLSETMTEFNKYYSVIDTNLRYKDTSIIAIANYVLNSDIATAKNELMQKYERPTDMIPLSGVILSNYYDKALTDLDAYGIYKMHGCIDKSLPTPSAKCRNSITGEDGEKLAEYETIGLRAIEDNEKIVSDAQSFIKRKIFTIRDVLEGAK